MRVAAGSVARPARRAYIAGVEALARGVCPDCSGAVVSMAEKIWFLKRCDLFERLTATESEHLERRAVMRAFKRGNIIYFPDDPGRSILALLRGRVKIKSLTAQGKETILAFIDEREIFGDVALLAGD